MTNEEKAREIENGILEEKTSFGRIVISGNCPENLQKKAKEFSEKVSNGHHYMDLEVGFIRGYQSALNMACEWLKDMACYYAHWECSPDTYENEIVYDTEKLIEDFKKAMEE